MKVSTSVSRTIRRSFTLLAAVGLSFATTNLAAQDQAIDLNPDGPVDPRAREHRDRPFIKESPPDPADNAQNLEINNAVDSFSEFVTSFQRDQAYKKYVNTYSIRGLRSLTDTLGAMIRPDDEKLMQEQQTLYNQVAAIEMMSAGERDVQPGIVQNALIDAATLFVNVQRQYYPDYDKQAQEIARLATTIRSDSPIKNQTDELNRFLLASSATLEQMALQPLNPIGGGPLDNVGQQTQNTPDVNPNADPNIDPNLTPTFDPNIEPNISDDLNRDYDINNRGIYDNTYNNNQYNNDYDNDEYDNNPTPSNPSTSPYDPYQRGTDPIYPTSPYNEPTDPLNPTYPVEPTEPLDSTDPMEITPLGPARPFDASNPEETAPLDF